MAARAATVCPYWTGHGAATGRALGRDNDAAPDWQKQAEDAVATSFYPLRLRLP